MDWSRSKSIFIFVFLILNIFLYSQYIDRYIEGQSVEMPGDKSIEAKLKEDNITYIALPNNIETASFVSGKVRNFTEEGVPTIPNIYTQTKNDHTLIATLKEPFKLANTTDKESFEAFFKSHVYEGESYMLWSIDEKTNTAMFFQRVNDRTLFYNENAYVKIYWDAEGRVYTYEQATLEKIEEYEKKVNIMTPIQVIQILYSKNLLKADSAITDIKLGYSTLVQLTQTQVFAPTWEVNVHTSEEVDEVYYVNAVDGKVIDMQGPKVEVKEK